MKQVLLIALLALPSVPAQASDCRAQPDSRATLKGAAAKTGKPCPVARPDAEPPQAADDRGVTTRVGNTTITVRGSVQVDVSTGFTPR